MKLYDLFKKKAFHIDLSLDRVEKALSHLSNPHKEIKGIIVSGTNGKGSTASFIESIARHHNLKTGLFTSPHLIQENERWRINNTPIDNSRLEEYINIIKPLIDRYSLTYFEACTVLAFKFFKDENVDIGIFEVGLGGRLDATNLLNPEVSVITNVSLDHTHLLGNTTWEIAKEKLGIARKDRPLVIGSNQMEIISQAVIMGIREIYHYPKGFFIQKKDGFYHYRFGDLQVNNLQINLLGEYQPVNCATGITAFTLFAGRTGLTLDKNSIREGVKNTKIAGRLEVVREQPTVILDGAHNTEAVEKLFKSLKKLFPNKRIITVFSAMADKNWERLLDIVKSNSHKVLTVKMPFERGIKEDDIKGKAEFYKTVEGGLEKAFKTANREDIILITGSLYLVGEALKLLKKGEDGRNTVN
ncbi:MAG: bifunctional folylpolyglutamate synthase/dihydrofolate synthase [Aquificae bacterium]|nr:bifunctional folylpolyglutamate synthase/dihydrofolate synthase [Aquificota bacterium]